MEKNKDSTTLPKIPAGLVAFVHDTSDNAVRTSKSLGNNAGQKYKHTEERIRRAVIAIKQDDSQEA